MRVRSLLLVVLLMFALSAGASAQGNASHVPITAQAGLDDVPLVFRQLGTYKTGIFADGGAEIVAHDPLTQRLFVVNSSEANSHIDVLNMSNPRKPTKVSEIDFSVYGDVANSVAVRNGVVAIAVEVHADDDETSQLPGKVVFYDSNGQFLSVVTVGALPDMLTFSPDGMKVLVANEGEPNDAYTFDPEGSVSIIAIPTGGVGALTQANVATAGFSDFNVGGSRRNEFDTRIRVYGPGASVAQDVEPEFITVSPDGATAYVTLQENNALAVIDVQQARVSQLVFLGYKDHGLAGNGLDASDEDGKINIANWPVRGLYQPDTIASFTVNNQTYLITANEGDSRDYTGFSEEARVADLTLDPAIFPNAAELQAETALGRLRVSTASGNTDADSDYEGLYAFGGRSFSIWTTDGQLVYDSGDDLEQITAATFPTHFNSNEDENNTFDDRSDDKGPEPEALTVGVVNGKTYAFIGLERIGGIMIFDITDPSKPVFQRYINNRNFAGDPAAGTANDLAPEGMIFIPAEQSPTGKPLLAVANEISGSTTLYQVGPFSTYLPLVFK